MAEIFPDEGLDLIINNTFGTATSLVATLYVGLFVSNSPTTVPARTATGGAAPSGWTEMTKLTGQYYRQAITTTQWGALSTNGNGRRRSGSQVMFTGFTSASAANGFFIATGSASAASDTILMFANFDSAVSRTLATISDQLLVTPTVQMDG